MHNLMYQIEQHEKEIVTAQLNASQNSHLFCFQLLATENYNVQFPHQIPIV